MQIKLLRKLQISSTCLLSSAPVSMAYGKVEKWFSDTGDDAENLLSPVSFVNHLSNSFNTLSTGLHEIREVKPFGSCLCDSHLRPARVVLCKLADDLAIIVGEMLPYWQHCRALAPE